LSILISHLPGRHAVAVAVVHVGIEMEVIDSCGKGNGGCEHVCHQDDGATTCSCYDGYTL